MATTTLIGKTYTIYKPQGATIVSSTTTIPPLGPHDILVRITHSGICGTDHVMSSLAAPIALGHEGVGIVEDVGSLVTQFRVGERAGGGFHRYSCGMCAHCLAGEDIHCYRRLVFSEGDVDNGTLSQYYVGKESFLHRIPDGMASEHAAPLQCAGATVYAALKATTKPGTRVGIFGIGGLGHLAIQYAAKLGAQPIVFSTSRNKEAEARSLGATEFYLVEEMFEKLHKPVDVVIVAGSKHPDWQRVLTKEFLNRGGTIVPLSSPTPELTLPAMTMIFQGYSVFSTMVSSRGLHDEMLDFSALHNIQPVVQIYKHEGVETIEKVFRDMEANRIRYRAVLEL